jgi:hypothetical protein
MQYTLKPQLEIGQRFELSVKHLLEIKGWTVKLNESDDLKQLQKYDLWITKNGSSYWVEVKKDIMSERTGNVCIDWDSLSKSKASLFVIGLPNEYGTDIFTMPLKAIYEYAKKYPVQKKVGQWGLENALIPKMKFIYLPFIKRFSMEESISPYESNTVRQRGNYHSRLSVLPSHA